MSISRRSFCCGLAVFPTTTDIAGAQAIIETTPPLPRPDMFEAGDLLWPKKPGVFVPYSQQIGTGPARDRQIWEQEKQEFLDRAVRGHTSLTSEQIADLRGLDYREFVARYHGDQKPGEPGVYSSGGGLYVGHVALIDLDSSRQPVVIEALWDRVWFGVPTRTGFREGLMRLFGSGDFAMIRKANVQESVQKR